MNKIVSSFIAAVIVVAGASVLGHSAQAQAAPQIVTAVGDSYTSGPGTGPAAESQSVYAPGTGQGSSGGNECYRSSWGYPQRLVESLNARNNGNTYQLTNVSCSGAVTNDITSPTTRVTSSGSTVSIPAQVDGIPANSNYVVLTIGGNDVGFSDFVTCILGNIYSSTPDCTNQSPAIIATNQKLTTVQSKISATLQAIKAKAPNAKILIAGYPQVAPDNRTILEHGCDPWLSNGEMVIANDIEQRLNTAVQQAAAANGATYVNQYKTPPFYTTACSTSINRQINGIVALSTVASFHPNNQGAFASAYLFSKFVN